MKTFFLTLALCAIVLCSFNPVQAQDIRQLVDNLDLTALSSMRVDSKTDLNAYYLVVQVLISNKNPHNLKFQKGNFKVTFDVAGRPLELGTAAVASHEVPKEKESLMTLAINVGPRNDATVEKLFEIFNITNGERVNQLKMLLEGNSEVGLGVTRGYFFEPGRRFQVALTYTPEVRRDYIVK